MLLRTNDTIVAVASATGGALRGILRISGPQALENASAWFLSDDGLKLSSLVEPTAAPGRAMLSGCEAYLPGELYVWPSNRSYTRQPTVEFHTIGSPPLLERLVQTVCRYDARPAEPGEFTLRAFLAGRLDLTQAEAVLGVIDAGSRTELDIALRQLAGGLARPLDALRNQLLDVLAHLEAGLDFAEEDIEFISPVALREQLAHAEQEVAALLARMTARATPSLENRVVIYGRPNAGKSSLLNALAQSQQAIVSAVAGTTRDYIATTLHCEGMPCLLVDTAGVLPTDEYAMSFAIDDAAQRATQQQRDDSHLRLLCLDASSKLDAWELAELAQPDEHRLLVLTKCDVPHGFQLASAISTSSHSGKGLATLSQAIAARLSALAATHGDVVAGTAIRCRDSLTQAQLSLEAAITALDCDAGEEFVAGELRMALEELGRIAGAVYTDDILDRIFSRFCIGK